MSMPFVKRFFAGFVRLFYSRLTFVQKLSIVLKI
nr:MAG TPA: hypothetical protein [Caudoviricetes sp.]